MTQTPSGATRSADDVRAAYTDRAVAAGYVAARFVAPLGAVLHEAQVRLVRDVIRQVQPRSVLELAPGPARLTTDVAPGFAGRMVLVDASAAMLAEARKRLPASVARRALFVRGDAFALPVTQPVDLVYSFRLIRHFEAADRGRLYGEVRRVLRPGGLLVFDAVNRAVADPMRANAAEGEYPIHDALLDPDQLREELDDAGFDLVSLVAVQKRYPLLYRIQILVAPRSRAIALAAMRVLERCPGGRPLEWIVSARRR